MAEMLGNDPTAAWLGAQLVSTDPVRVAMTVRDEHTNFYGTTHGGVVFTLADVGMSLVSNAETTSLAIETP